MQIYEILEGLGRKDCHDLPTGEIKSFFFQTYRSFEYASLKREKENLSFGLQTAVFFVKLGQSMYERSGTCQNSGLHRRHVHFVHEDPTLSTLCRTRVKNY